MAERSAAMVCPVDGTTLVMSERQNIEIDYCTTCRGVWLDRGELDKIIERSAPAEGAQAAQPGGKSGLGETRPARGCDGTDVDHQPDAGGDKLPEEFVERLPFIADRPEPARHRCSAQSKISSRKLFFLLW